MNDIILIVIGVLILIVLMIGFSRRKKASLDGMKTLVQEANLEMQEASKKMQIANRKINELYKAILKVEGGMIEE